MRKSNVLMAWLVALALVCVTIFFSSPAGAKSLSCKQVFTTKYVNGALHKAMATSGGRPPSSSMDMQCGWARGYSSKKEAIAIALRDCRRADRNYKNRRDCKIVYAE